MIDRDLGPLRRRAPAKAKGVRHRDDAAELPCGLENDRIAFAHGRRYSTAIPSRQAPLYPHTGGRLDNSDMALHEKIRAARREAQKTQEQVAEQIGLTKGAVSQWETGETVPDLESFRLFCVYTGASADDLLLDRAMSDPLLARLIGIWNQLTPDGKDRLLGAANRILAEEQASPPESPKNQPKNGTRPIKRPPFS